MAENKAEVRNLNAQQEKTFHRGKKTNLEEPKRYLGIDYGTVRVGTAISDSLGILARRYETIPNRGEDFVIQRLCEIIEKEQIGKIILGMPERTDGKIGEMEKKVKSFSKKLQAASKLRPIFQNEALTSMEAEELMRETEGPLKDKKGLVDQLAAEIILQDYLNAKS